MFCILAILRIADATPLAARATNVSVQFSSQVVTVNESRVIPAEKIDLGIVKESS